MQRVAVARVVAVGEIGTPGGAKIRAIANAHTWKRRLLRLCSKPLGHLRMQLDNMGWF